MANGGLITREDLKAYRPKKRAPIRGTYRGYEIISMPPPSSGGIVLVEMLNILERYDVAGDGFGSARNLHRMAEAMRRAYSDRAQYLGDPDFNPDMPIDRLTSKVYADELRKTIRADKASKSSPESFIWPAESPGDYALLRSGLGAQRRIGDPTRSSTVTAPASSSPARVSCSTTRWETSTAGPE